MTDRTIVAADPAPAGRAGQAGLLAALLMLAVQLVWRLNWSQNGVVQAFPEFIVAAISRLTPLSIFGAATENYGGNAKKTLFVAVLFGIVAVGYQAGRVAGWLSRRIDRGAGGRFAAGFAVAGALLLFTLAVVMPIAHLGFFASDSSYTNDILVQSVVTFALFAVAWALLAAPAVTRAVEPTGLDTLSRRAALGRAGWGVATLAAVATVGVSTWRLVAPRAARVGSMATEIGTETTVQDIVATQRALQGHPLPTPTTPISEVAAQEAAALHSDVMVQEADPFALFVQLDAEQKITPVLTETDDFYHVSKNFSDPKVGADSWSLKITGLVERELELSHDDLVARATTQKITTLGCISNPLNGNLIGTAQWTGVPLVDLLNEAGIKPGAVDLKFHAADDYEDSVPIERGMDPDNLVVVGMNGETLRDDHGYPARLIIPNIYGMKNVKWLERIEVVDEDFKGYWESRGWSDDATFQIWGRIDEPGDGDTWKTGPNIATGVASAGDRDVARVEISLDDGETWADATLEPSLNPPFTWVRWAYQ
ncbi:MAG TPA: molybdopterin-dependent oxidoreductase, partial [Thermomicrobiales bacterium]|nr:molybdopterin-dependent oxidoreductase [Thermomicrobiales bacterium]